MPYPHLAIFFVSFKSHLKHTFQFSRVGMQRRCCLPPQIYNLSSGYKGKEYWAWIKGQIWGSGPSTYDLYNLGQISGWASLSLDFLIWKLIILIPSLPISLRCYKDQMIGVRKNLGILSPYINIKQTLLLLMYSVNSKVKFFQSQKKDFHMKFYTFFILGAQSHLMCLSLGTSTPLSHGGIEMHSFWEVMLYNPVLKTFSKIRKV